MWLRSLGQELVQSSGQLVSSPALNHGVTLPLKRSFPSFIYFFQYGLTEHLLLTGTVYKEV
jgi:hypothetical protein